MISILFLLLAAPMAEPDTIGTRTAGSDWPCFLGPTGDNKSTETGIATPWTETGPPIVWQQRTGTGYGMPSISRGRLVQFSRLGNQARVECMNAETGEHLWRFEYPTDYRDIYGYDNGPRAQPVVDGDRVYTFGVEGMLHCLRLETGELVWKLDTTERFHVVQNFFGVGSTPVVEGDLLIVQIGGSPPEDRDIPPGQLDRVHGDHSGVVAFNRHTGDVVYQLSSELASYASPKLATIAGRRWCFVFARAGLLAFEPASGKADFHFPWRAPILESVNASTPVVVDDLVFISETYGPGSAVLKVHSGGYDVVWRDELRSRAKHFQAHWNTPIEHEGYLYGSSGRHRENAELRCIELRTGKVMWSEPGLSRSSLLYVDGHFVCLTEEGDLYLLRATPEKFDVVSQVLLPASKDPDVQGEPRLLKYPCWAAAILSHGLLYVRGHDRLVCLELIGGNRP
ncbi:MAG TPA: PQQ-binding-like beta-propeller repeat protein [Pirellulales bacterium]|jgi:outer membrane protein assembly factor BamB|nr:PQQ-binding-like beta-propeller repeat protein [Pirellulales bacterium]